MIDKLEFLIALASEQHFGRAARACGVTQPTLSAGLKQLEGMFGVMLVQRGAHFVGFTDEGEKALEWARRIVAAVRGARQDMDAMREGLSGHLRIAAIPTALAMVAMLTTPFRTRHPDVLFTVLSRTSEESLALLDNLEVDAAVSYLDAEPTGEGYCVPLYRESYRLMTSVEGALGDREQVTWAEVGSIPLCLLTPDMRNRQIIDRLLRSAGNEPAPRLQSNSMIVLYAHVRTGRWASVMPAKLAETLELTDTLRSIPIVEPEETHTVGLIFSSTRKRMTMLASAFAEEARRLAKVLEPSLPPSRGPRDAACATQVRPEALR